MLKVKAKPFLVHRNGMSELAKIAPPVKGMSRFVITVKAQPC